MVFLTYLDLLQLYLIFFMKLIYKYYINIYIYTYIRGDVKNAIRWWTSFAYVNSR